MTNAPTKKEHFNLYYIFKEDKEKNVIPKDKIEQYYKKVHMLIKKNN